MTETQFRRSLLQSRVVFNLKGDGEQAIASIERALVLTDDPTIAERAQQALDELRNP